MSSATTQKQASGAGISWQATATRSSGQGLPTNETLQPGVAAVVLVKTDGDTATFTLPDGHGLPASGFCCVYFATGLRYGCAFTVAGDVLTINNTGTGTDFPVATTVVVISQEMDLDVNVNPAKAVFIGCASNQRTHIRYVGINGAAVLGNPIELLPDQAGAEAEWSWLSKDSNTPGVDVMGVPCPLVASPSNPVDTIIVSNGSALAAANFKGLIIYDPTI